MLAAAPVKNLVVTNSTNWGLTSGDALRVVSMTGVFAYVLQEMFAEADKDGDGMLSYGELTAAMKQASKEYSHLEEYARYLER